jgi:hypothetical protein
VTHARRTTAAALALVAVSATACATASTDQASAPSLRTTSTTLAVARQVGTLTGRTSAEDKGTVGVDFRTGGAVGHLGVVACPAPEPDERAQAAAEVAATGPVAAAGGPVRVLVVGDSLGCSVAVGLGPGGAPVVDMREATIVGCGVVSGQVFDEREPFPSGTERCAAFTAALEQAALDAFRPHVVLWVSTWERFNLVVGDQLVRTGSAAWRAELQRRLELGSRRLTAGGARLVLMTVAAPAPASMLGGGRVVGPGFDWRFRPLNEELTRFAATHPGTGLVDAAARICPGGPPCPALVDGREPRRGDGVHFHPAGAVWLSRWMLPELLAAPSTSEVPPPS